jgi:hypothetical protein
MFWLRYESYACGGLLNLLIHLIFILAHGYLLIILLWPLCEDSLLFCKSWHNGVHNYFNTYLYALWSTLILNLIHSISFFSRFMFNEFIAKGGEIVHKVGWTLANRVVERKNMINDYLRGRAYIECYGEFDSGGVLSFVSFLWSWAFLSSSLPFCLALPLFLLFAGFCGFPSSIWHSWVFCWLLVF